VAQKIYKQQLPDGSVVYADHRIKGAKLLYQVAVPDEAPAPVARGEASARSAEAAALDQRLRERTTTLDRAHREIVVAERAVEDAKRQLETGKELLPGELQNSATGGTRVLPEYFDRIKKLEDNVTKAQTRLDRVYSERNQLR
jgi:chromosome segregation ATPase